MVSFICNRSRSGTITATALSERQTIYRKKARTSHGILSEKYTFEIRHLKGEEADGSVLNAILVVQGGYADTRERAFEIAA
ncbi:hypothetical protein [Brevundimonas sp.]|uniref:hypothetical protein n=1 Tax=Brevundimonas sp. TaxID=1871086 RepID=UPI0028A8024D|nr:hypothetical protein [Brevundimonas sp.]